MRIKNNNNNNKRDQKRDEIPKISNLKFLVQNMQ